MADLLRLRAHQVLCLQGFRGLGYSPAFVEALTAVHETLTANPRHDVELTTAPDDLCRACPHLRADEGCTLGGPRHEDHMRQQDEAVLTRLGLAPGTRLPWIEILAHIRTAVAGSDLPHLCTTCPWLPLGYCVKGLDDLRT